MSIRPISVCIALLAVLAPAPVSAADLTVREMAERLLTLYHLIKRPTPEEEASASPCFPAQAVPEVS